MRSVMKTAFDDGKFTTVFTAHHAVLLKTMAMAGRGIAWLPESLIAADLEAKRLVLAGDSEWAVPIEVRLFRPRTPLSEAAEALRTAVSDGHRLLKKSSSAFSLNNHPTGASDWLRQFSTNRQIAFQPP